MDKESLSNHIRACSSPIEPLPTATSPSLGKAGTIRAVVFDIYGTLFISGSGDISLARQEDRGPAICAALETAGFAIRKPDAPWSDAFMAQLDQARRDRMAMGVTHPEVRIEEVWQALVDQAASDGWLSGSGGIELAIVDHECRVNPCWPMPGLETTLRRLRDRGIPLGIVSNAQFYTPLLFPALLQADLAACGFDPSISVWSYREREGKPSRRLYRKLKDALEAQDIAASETLYVGNDLRNDVWPAQLEGFRTVLFAGDERSLRWREDDPACRDVRPDFIVARLDQLLDIIAL